MTDLSVLPNGNLFMGCFTKRSLLSYMRKEYDSVLDVGCSIGETLKVLREWGMTTVAGCDVSDSAKEMCVRDGIAFKEVDLNDVDLQLPYADDEFDVVLCTHVLEHIKYPHQVVREMYRVAKHLVCIIVPAGLSYDAPSHINHWHVSEDIVKDLLYRDWAFSIELSISKPSDVQLYYAAFLVCIYKDVVEGAQEKEDWVGDHHPLYIYIGERHEKN